MVPRKITCEAPSAPGGENAVIPLGRREKTYRVEVVTPMFGGVFPGIPDDVTPVRVSSIRGQLRFWWRATRGCEFPDAVRLAEREGEIWGTTEEPSKVSLSVVVVSKGTAQPCAAIPPNGRGAPRANREYPGYVTFPFHQDSKSIRNAKRDLVFDLRVSCPDEVWNDVEAALWAWCNFGGLGARTRRGCGAVFCEDFAPKDASELSSKMKTYRHAADGPVHAWPELFTAILLKENGAPGAIPSWNDSIRLLQTFRQGPEVGRNSGDMLNRPGRSRWPEPETIRAVTRKRDQIHARMAAIPEDGFPRAAFGLPIVFHFQSRTDPQDTQLLPLVSGAAGNRMASPMILRPLLFKGRRAAAMILQLRTPRLESVALGARVFQRDGIVHERFASYPKSPLGAPLGKNVKRSPGGSAIEGFLSFAKENGFQEVKP